MKKTSFLIVIVAFVSLFSCDNGSNITSSESSSMFISDSTNVNSEFESINKSDISSFDEKNESESVESNSQIESIDSTNNINSIYSNGIEIGEIGEGTIIDWSKNK